MVEESVSIAYLGPAGTYCNEAALVFVGNLIANILYGVVDPRIRKGEGSHV